MLTISFPTTVKHSYQVKNFGSEGCFGLVLKADYSFLVTNVAWAEGDILTEGIEALQIALLKKNIAISIGCDCFTSARIISLSFPENQRIQTQEASLSIETDININIDTGSTSPWGDLMAILGSYTSLFSSLQEDYQFSANENEYSYKRNFSFEINQTLSSGAFSSAMKENMISLVRAIFFVLRPNLSEITTVPESARVLFSDERFRRIVNEDFDDIRFAGSFSEELKVFNLSGSSDSYSLTEEITNKYERGGEVEKTYSLNLKAAIEPVKINILTALKAEQDRIISENSSRPVSQIEISANDFEGTGSLSISFGRIDSTKTEFYKYTKTISTKTVYKNIKPKKGKPSKTRVTETTISISVQGYGTSADQRLSNAKLAPINTTLSGVGTLVASSYSESKFKGTVNSSKTYSDDPDITEDGYMNSTTSDTPPITETEELRDIKGQPLSFDLLGYSLGSYISEAELNIPKNKTRNLSNLSNVFANIKLVYDESMSHYPNVSCYWETEISIKASLSNGQFSSSVSYNYLKD